jgi:hypothetical protein
MLVPSFCKERYTFRPSPPLSYVPAVVLSRGTTSVGVRDKLPGIAALRYTGVDHRR